MTDPNAAGLHPAWHELLDALRAGDVAFTDGHRGDFDPRETAHGYRNLTSIFAFALGMYMHVDREEPRFAPSPKDPPGEKTLGEHPDVRYQWAAIRGGRRYRITGRRGDEAYLSFTVHRGVRGSGFEQAFDSHLNHHDLRTDADGRFEIVVSPESEGDNWLRTSDDANEIYARAYHLDPDRDRPAEYRIEALDPPPPRSLQPEDIEARLREMAGLVRDMTIAMPQPLDAPNTMGELWRPDREGPSRMWSAVDNVYARGVFRLQPDEVLLLQGAVVPCDYWGVQLWSPFLGSGDSRHQRVTINNAQARLGPRGEFRVAIARRDPRVPDVDWISTAGERQGTFFIRWMCPAAMPPAPTCRLLTFEALRAAAGC